MAPLMGAFHRDCQRNGRRNRQWAKIRQPEGTIYRTEGRLAVNNKSSNGTDLGRLEAIQTWAACPPL
jgi:hypothetical protein